MTDELCSSTRWTCTVVQPNAVKVSAAGTIGSSPSICVPPWTDSTVITSPPVGVFAVFTTRPGPALTRVVPVCVEATWKRSLPRPSVTWSASTPP